MRGKRKAVRLSSNKYTKDKYFYVSPEVYDEVKTHRWCVVRNGHGSHLRVVRAATKQERATGYPNLISIHRWIMGMAKKGKAHQTIDHKNRNIFDNTFNNLVKASHYAQSRNLKSNNGLTSLWGVTKEKNNRKFRGRYRLKGKTISVGYFHSEVEAHTAAVRAYRKATGKEPRITV